MNVRTVIIAALTIFTAFPIASGGVVWMEAEAFDNTGKWSNDSQHVDVMGSPYLLATGVGRPVKDAVTSAKIPSKGKYTLWVRCRDWFPSHSPGKFSVIVGGEASGVTFGKAKTDDWRWVSGGVFDLPAGPVKVAIRDLTGWWARCDAVVLASGDFKPSDDAKKLAAQRMEFCGVTPGVKSMGVYDVVVVGGGPAGMGAATAAARHGAKVALIQDRPVLGGNSSSEIQVPPMGYTGDPPDRVNITGLAEEFFPEQGWSSFADAKKMEAIVRAEKNILLHLNTRGIGVEMSAKDRIKSVIALDVRTGQRMSFAAPLFIDCTGHGWIGYYAGAEYRMGQEARAEFNESLAPVAAGKRTMGNALYNAGFKTHPKSDDNGAAFDCPLWAYQWRTSAEFEKLGTHRRIRTPNRPENFDGESRGKGRNPGDDPNGAVLHQWWVELGGMSDIIADAENIRDELFRINIGMWNYAKNYNPKTIVRNKHRRMVWLNYVPGVRESRRLMGDYVMTQLDFDKRIVHPDTIGFTDWGIDVHHPEGFWVRGNDCIHVYHGRRISIPYRSLYSKNIANLFMAGRCHSATHIALGATRVMRPMMLTGQAAGTAAAIATENKTSPRGVYKSHIAELQQRLLKDGCYLLGVKNADKRDLALGAKLTASSSAKGMEPAKTINGWNRIVAPDRNAWTPEKTAEGPHWIELHQAAIGTIDTVHVTFEKGKSVGFSVEAWAGGGFKAVADFPKNKLRRCVVSFKPITTDRVRIVFQKIPVVCEVRIYNETTE